MSVINEVARLRGRWTILVLLLLVVPSLAVRVRNSDFEPETAVEKLIEQHEKTGKVDFEDLIRRMK